MQVITGYQQSLQIRNIQKFRLYHFNRPVVKKWRKSRHTGKFILDEVDQWIVKNYQHNFLIAVDCAGWYFNDHGVNTICLEGDPISQLYCPDVHLEPDIFTHRPDYLDQDHAVLFKFPWFLRYAKLPAFLNFLNIWTTSTMILNFDPLFVQHNHLKFNLKDLVEDNTCFKIQQNNKNLWIVTQ
jgi:hypothetical protein